ncbi:MAG: hypothetical protein WA017_12320, partial [Desulfosalsimonadaceae bacterium]
LCLKKPNKMIERSESSLNNPENNCHSQNNQKNQLHFFLEINKCPNEYPPQKTIAAIAIIQITQYKYFIMVPSSLI